MLLFIDSFDHYQTAQIPAKWTSLGAVGPVIANGVGRCGTNALYVDVSGGRSVTKGVPFAGSTVVVGFALQVLTHGIPGPETFFYLSDPIYHQLSLRRSQDGSLSVYREDVVPTLLGTSPPGVTQTNEWSYIEFKATIDPAAGAVAVRVNGIDVLVLAGIKTKSGMSGSNGVSGFTFNGGISQFNYYVDDLYALDATGALNNDFLGDCRVEYLAPIGPGAHQDWSLVGAPSHWQAIDDGSTPDDDATYIHTATVGQIDTEQYAPTGLPAGSIFGVQLNVYARKTDSGFREVVPIVRHGGVDYAGMTQAPSFASYRYLMQLYETNPGTSVPWTIADVNTDQYGVQLSV